MVFKVERIFFQPLRFLYFQVKTEAFKNQLRNMCHIYAHSLPPAYLGDAVRTTDKSVSKYKLRAEQKC